MKIFCSSYHMLERTVSTSYINNYKKVFIFLPGIQQDDPLNNDVFGGLLGNDGFGDEFGEGVLPPLEDLPPLAAYDASLDPLKEAEGREGAVELMETDELREQEEKTAEEEGRTAGEEKKTTEETEDSPELTRKILKITNTNLEITNSNL
jgi:hypothetical protein